jgi:UDP-2,4-diacetamido-2,4,6-trideoxy-beta-L-altropyranose hydrolase|tara:strand:+ start:247 stop:1326 length:1080 start_codon:yes stop_codon:yes gene_type:complete
MTIAFRVDASILIGTGHVMRCLALANYLKSLGYCCLFICRAHKGHLGAFILSQGHQLQLLDGNEDIISGELSPRWNSHSDWLGVHWSVDVDQSLRIIKDFCPEWLVIDHYALDVDWEIKIKPFVKSLMVIDDLADRKHDCDFLLDQTFGRQKEDYSEIVPNHCVLLCGAQYSLLRKEFSRWRNASLEYRETASLNNILVNLGGVDKDDFTSSIMQSLSLCALPHSCVITVVMGANAPWIANVKNVAAKMPWETHVKVGVENMAEIMSKADLAIGAAGSTTWERCCLGLPTIQLVIAENQNFVAQSLVKAGVIKLLTKLDQLPVLIETAPDWMYSISMQCRLITDGQGVERVAESLYMTK